MSTTRIADNLRLVRERISAAAERAGRDPQEIRLVAVTKTFGPETVVEALEAGLTDCGENRVQEALPKIEAVADLCRGQGIAEPIWHLIGHLQTNKVKAALGAFAIVHSIDSLHLAVAIDRRASAIVPVLIEVNAGGESTKSGFAPGSVAGALAVIGRLRGVQPLGLMTVAPRADDESVRKVFITLRELAAANGLRELSMGMSEDFEIAVEEGATCLRLGRVLFGERSG